MCFSKLKMCLVYFRPVRRQLYHPNCRACAYRHHKNPQQHGTPCADSPNWRPARMWLTIAGPFTPAHGAGAGGGAMGLHKLNLCSVGIGPPRIGNCGPPGHEATPILGPHSADPGRDSMILHQATTRPNSGSPRLGTEVEHSRRQPGAFRQEGLGRWNLLTCPSPSPVPPHLDHHPA